MCFLKIWTERDKGRERERERQRERVYLKAVNIWKLILASISHPYFISYPTYYLPPRRHSKPKFEFLSLNQCDQIGDFLSFLVTNFLKKLAQILWYLLGLFLIIQLSRINYLATFWAISDKIGHLLIHHLVTLVSTPT